MTVADVVPHSIFFEWRRRRRGLMGALVRPKGVLSYQSIKYIRPVYPFCERTVHESGTTYGCGPASYDIRIAQDILVEPGRHYIVSAVERFLMPDDVSATVHDKSTWARELLVAQNTLIDPGFKGGLTIELSAHGARTFEIMAGTPIVQIQFGWLDETTDRPYRGKYYDQTEEPQPPIYEKAA
jgi:dCTP deaminase